MVLSGAQLQSLGMDAAALRRKRSEEQHDDIVASMRRHCMEGKQRKRSRRQVLRSSTAVTCPLRYFIEGGCAVGQAVLQTTLWNGIQKMNPGQGVFFPRRRREHPVAHGTSVFRRFGLRTPSYFTQRPPPPPNYQDVVLWDRVTRHRGEHDPGNTQGTTRCF